MLCIILLLQALVIYASSSCRFSKTVNENDYVYDLSPLHLQEGWQWSTSDVSKGKDYQYYFSPCGVITTKPGACNGLENSVGYRVSVGSHIFMHGLTCLPLGDPTLKHTTLIDPKDPLKGVEVTFRRPGRVDALTERDTPKEWKDAGKGMGFHLSKSQAEKFLRILTPCHDHERVVTYHLICSPHFDSGPIKVYEDKEQCHVNVTWPSRHGCPLRSKLSTPGSGYWGRESGYSSFQDIGGFYVIMLVVITCASPFACQLVAKTGGACSRGRPGKRRHKANLSKYDEGNSQEIRKVI